MRFNVAIVGGGVAGNATAYELSRRGYKVVVLEKNREIGNKVCGGLVSQRVIKLSKTESVLNDIKGAYVFFPNGKEICIGGDKTHAYVIDREKFDKELAEKAMAEGVEYKLGFKVEKIYEKKLVGKEEINFDYLVGADGARSLVAEKYDMGRVNYINAIQGESGKKIDDDFVSIYIDKKISLGFFSWIIPDGEKVRIGTGSIEKNLREKFNLFLKRIDASAENIRSALIPVGMRKFYIKNVTLTGDSAGLVKATSGGGIYASLLSAKILAENFEDFKKYRTEFMKKFGNELKKCLIARKIFLKMKNEDFNFFAEHIEKEIDVINKYGDLDYQTRVAIHFIKKHLFLIPHLFHIILRKRAKTFFISFIY
ncbi:MAG TPA: geranylgeranyl reductase family protein [Thermoplasmatales archaeon]|nr:geranylgeranyl reductase family protein [Thermoplasmatales archaeon]